MSKVIRVSESYLDVLETLKLKKQITNKTYDLLKSLIINPKPVKLAGRKKKYQTEEERRDALKENAKRYYRKKKNASGNKSNNASSSSSDIIIA